MTDIKTTRQLNYTWNTYILVNEHDREHKYQMSIPSLSLNDGTTLGWVMNYGTPDRTELLSAISIMGSYQYLLSADITAKEALSRLKMLRTEYQSQPTPKETL